MEDKAWDRQTLPAEGAPHAWIQWQATDVCMDVHCACGAQSHLDTSFAYYVVCPKCEQVYMCNGHIELVPLLDGEVFSGDVKTPWLVDDDD
jgi:hypothetical protein